MVCKEFKDFYKSSKTMSRLAGTRRIESISLLKVHKNENFFGFDFEFCPISLLVMHK